MVHDGQHRSRRTYRRQLAFFADSDVLNKGSRSKRGVGENRRKWNGFRPTSDFERLKLTISDGTHSDGHPDSGTSRNVY